MEDKKQNAATRAKEKYNAAHYDQVKFTVRKGGREVIDSAAEKVGISRNAYILKAVIEQMKRDGIEYTEESPDE
ncbi:transcriptional regulator [Cohnella cholangitidis]|uniref:Transcriptional regulator n=1 Tax=Cohnella cholangitidis TaxID=2598458 RepID=A0A7G5C5J6_9BACL|nr:transcriptional regulator [Cohnella cholangitidis]QMV44480.1 transcriptional regulator [Cohnella cholangitidis]